MRDQWRPSGGLSGCFELLVSRDAPVAWTMEGLWSHATTVVAAVVCVAYEAHKFLTREAQKFLTPKDAPPSGPTS